MNKFNELAEQYTLTNQKPDKRYSILPTVLGLLGDLEGKVVVDVGSGDGFFSRAIAERNPSRVYGIDSSLKQIRIAKSFNSHNIIYISKDIFASEIPKCDLINAPFVLNYSSSLDELRELFHNCYRALNEGGNLVLVMDLPKLHLSKEQRDKKRWIGAVKTVESDLIDEAKIKIELFNMGDYICTLNSNYFSPDSIESLLLETGFSSIEWHDPMISEEGLRTHGEEFWSDYLELCELGYIIARRKNES